MDKQNIRKMLIKVPEITVIFWVIKILTTGMGEIFSDWFCAAIDKYVAVMLGLLFLIISLIIQLLVRKYIPYVYWFAVLMVSIFGTMFADVLHIGLGIPYIVSTIFFAVLMIIIFVWWQKSEKTLDIHSIFTTRREIFYWLTVLVTFAFGTAAGDFTATTLHLGYLASAILFAVTICLPWIGAAVWHWNEIFAFWFAYILTRPLGASIADWISMPKSSGGLDFGKGLISLVMFIIIVILVAYLSFTYKSKTTAIEN